MFGFIFTSEFLLGLFLLVLYFFWYKDRDIKGYNLPPGPYQWPLFGNTLQLGKRPYLAFLKWTKEYGDIYQMNMIGHRTVVVSDEKLIRHAFNNSELTGRPKFEIFDMLQEGPHGLINSQKEEWVEQRRFTLRHLRDFGFGKGGMEDLIQDEVKDLLTHLTKLEGQPIESMKEKFSLAVVNALWMMVSGHRYAMDDPELLQLYRKMTRFNDEMSFAILFPRLAKLWPSMTGLTRIRDFATDLRSFIINTIDDHVKNPPNDPTQPRDFIDAYLKEINDTKDPSSSFYGAAGRRSMIATVLDLYFAGLETTSNSLNYSVLYMAKHPEIQKKIQEELDSTIGQRAPTLADRVNLVYCEAAILELLRKSSIVPLSLIHIALSDLKIAGYDVPKGTWVTGNFYHVHHNEELWDKPDEYNPSRFLKEEIGPDGQKQMKIQRPSTLMSFSVGKRVCMGEIMARDSIFLFFTSLLQKFNVQFTEDSKNVSLEPKPGLNMTPQPFKVILTERFK